MNNKIMHIFPNVSMSNGHDGLEQIAMRHKVSLNDLQVGQFAMFINRSFTAVKVFAANRVIIHYKNPKGHLLNYKALKLVPEFYNGQSIEYTKALKKVILKEYPYLNGRNED